MMVKPAVHNRYQYNPDCVCDICKRDGVVPTDHPEFGHSFCYGLPHVPPVSVPPWRNR